MSAEFGPSQSTINRLKCKFDLGNRRRREVPHEQTNDQAQRRVNIRKYLLASPQDIRFGRRLVTGDERRIYFRNPKRNHWLRSIHGVLHFQLVLFDHTVNAALFAQQLQRVYDDLKARHPSLVNRRGALLQHNITPAHTANVTKHKLEGLEVLPQAAYSPNHELDDHLF